jgi:hypothetical protein
MVKFVDTCCYYSVRGGKRRRILRRHGIHVIMPCAEGAHYRPKNICVVHTCFAYSHTHTLTLIRMHDACIRKGVCNKRYGDSLPHTHIHSYACGRGALQTYKRYKPTSTCVCARGRGIQHMLYCIIYTCILTVHNCCTLTPVHSKTRSLENVTCLATPASKGCGPPAVSQSS